MEPGGRDLLAMILEMGSEARLGACTVVEADMDALALIDEAKRLGAAEVTLLGPRHRPGRSPGVYVEEVEPAEPGSVDPQRIVKELWGNLTGSLRLDDYVAAMRLLYGGRFRVAECEPGEEGGGCRGVAEKWLREYCGQA